MTWARRLDWLVIGATLAVAAPSGAALAATRDAPAGRCTVAAIQAMAPKDTTITSADVTAKPVPHCKVDGFVTTTNPGPNKVQFRLQLPQSAWAGRYYFIGMGAAAGYVPTDSQIPAGNPLHGGFAVAGTDTGHIGPMADWSFMGRNPAQAVDHIHRGAHVTAVSTQQITQRYYGVDKMYRYHSGCSGGGRMGMMALEHHPGDFDGILLGAPGGRSSATMIKFISAAQEMTREPGAWVSPAKLKMVEKHVTAACDALDGAVDDMVNDHRVCRFDVAQLACKDGDAADCLTQPEIRSIKAINRGPLGPDGKPITEGMPLTNTSTWAGFTGANPPPWTPEAQASMKGNSGLLIAQTLSQALFGDDYDALKQFDSRRKADMDAWWAASRKLGYGMPYSADISAFQKAGGKLLLWNGVSDSCCSDVELEQWYNEIGQHLPGGDKAVPDLVRYYRIPGMAHCGGGTGPGDGPDQLLLELIDWVEKGQSPGPVVAHRGPDRVKLLFSDPSTGVVSGVIVPPPEGAARDFLLCPLPQVATFNGSKAPGAALEASNWSCKVRPPGTAARNGHAPG